MTKRVSQISQATADWYARVVSAVDSRDLDAFLAHITDDCTIQVNDALPVYGKAAYQDAMVRYYGAFDKTEHEILNLYGDDEHVVAELLCHYTPQGASKPVTMPAVAIYDRNGDGLLTSIRLYVGGGVMFEAFTGAVA